MDAKAKRAPDVELDETRSPSTRRLRVRLLPPPLAAAAEKPPKKCRTRSVDGSGGAA